MDHYPSHLLDDLARVYAYAAIEAFVRETSCARTLEAMEPRELRREAISGLTKTAEVGHRATPAANVY